MTTPTQDEQILHPMPSIGIGPLLHRWNRFTQKHEFACRINRRLVELYEVDGEIHLRKTASPWETFLCNEGVQAWHRRNDLCPASGWEKVSLENLTPAARNTLEMAINGRL